jgi:hypothetical protein
MRTKRPNTTSLDNRLTDGADVVNVTLRPLSTPQKEFLVIISVRG